MLDSKNEVQKPGDSFLLSLSGVVGSRWPSMAMTLSLSDEDIEELNGKVGLHEQNELALQVLKKWASNEMASYGQLLRRLKEISIFQHVM